jgi:phenylacetic acid degradation operon negative regulatory protein
LHGRHDAVDPPDTRAGSAPVARTMLLMVLGAHVFRRREDVWQETLVGAVQAVGHTERTARQAIARSTREGWLEAERHGRRARMRLTGKALEILADGERRLFAFGEPRAWDGTWLLVAVRVPESNRQVRHRLRTRLAWAGFGSLGGGLWLSPHVDREREVAAAISEEGVAEVVSFRARLGELGDLDRLVRSAWDVEAILAGYRDFARQFGALRPESPRDSFAADISLLHAWRRLLLLDPELPTELLPNGSLRKQAYGLFHERHALWLEPARVYFDAQEAEVDPGRAVSRAAGTG